MDNKQDDFPWAGILLALCFMLVFILAVYAYGHITLLYSRVTTLQLRIDMLEIQQKQDELLPNALVLDWPKKAISNNTNPKRSM